MSKDKVKSVQRSSQRGFSAQDKKVSNATFLMWPIVFLLYLVMYLKSSGFTWQQYFSNYDNSIAIWSVGFDFFKTIFSTLDTLTSVLGLIFNFIVDFISKIIDYITVTVNTVIAITKTSFIDRLAAWFKLTLEGLNVL